MKLSSCLYLIFFFAFLAYGCVKKPQQNQLFNYRKGFTVDIAEKAKRGIYYTGLGKFNAAHREFNYALRYSPTNCQLNFLNALAYHIEGGKGNVKRLNLAEIGYELAIKFCPYDPWPHYYYGLILAKKKRYKAAENQFSLAVRYDNNKENQHFLNAYLVSSYNSGDYLVASNLIRQLNKIDPDDKYSKLIQKRLTLISTRKPDYFAKVEWKSTYEKLRQKQKSLPHSKKQFIIDAVIILSQEEESTNTGINLLNGLQMTYALSKTLSDIGTGNILQFMKNTNDSFGTPTAPSTNAFPFNSVVTHTISIPAVNYSLNVFNRSNEKDEILARPSLLVEDGGKATYFSGNQLLLGIEGTQVGSITEKDIGISLEVEPVFQKNGSIEMEIRISRTFIQPSTTATTFDQVAETIKQDTKTKVNLRYGETVILSALTENIQSDGENATEGLGRVPLLKYLFSNRQKRNVSNNILILLTPRPYISFDSNVDNKRIEQQINKLYHRVINPNTDLNKAIMSTQTMRTFSRPITITTALYDSDFLKKATENEFNMLTEEVQ